MTKYLLFLLMITPQLFAQDLPFELVDRVCLLVNGQPVLQSEIKKHQKNNKTFAKAKEDLIDEELLWLLAKRFQISTTEILKSAEDHLKNIMSNNKLSQAQLADVLRKAPYLTTYDRFKKETALSLLKSALASKISITDEDVNKEVQKEKSSSYGVSFISANKNSVKINKIVSRINGGESFSAIMKIYQEDKDISIIGPMIYREGTLNPDYESRLKNAKLDQGVVGPFLEEDSKTIIWKMKNPPLSENERKVLVEKVRERLYREALKEQINGVRNFAVIIDNCDLPQQ